VSTETTTWAQVAARAGRNDLPGLLFQHLDDLPVHDLPKALGEAWTAAEWPEALIPRDAWLWAFGLATQGGYDAIIVDDEVVEREESGDLAEADIDGLVTLYRGAIPARRDGMSWTPNRGIAEWFAHRFDGMEGDQGGKVWRANIPAAWVVAIFTTARGEAEFVVDTADLTDDDYEEA
jgi:hypothetical protein